MRTLIGILALTALAAACVDQPVAPLAEEPGIEIAAPSFAKFKPDMNPGAFNEWWNFCFLPDATGKSFPVALPCHFVAVPGPSEVWTLHIFASGVPNPTGKAYHFGPTNYSAGMEKMYYDLSGGLVVPVDGKMPACDYNLATDPEQTTWICTTNWHYTISASGQGKFTSVADPKHSWKVPCNRCWG